jgi:hypothetical protein
MMKKSTMRTSSSRQWWTGVIVKREIEQGIYEPQFISLKTLEQMYG